jgi:hypothetical protein
MEWLPEFALTASECATLGHQNAAKLLRLAAKRVYDTKKFENRGEFGEVLLHAAIRQIFDSLPAVSKIGASGFSMGTDRALRSESRSPS